MKGNNISQQINESLFFNQCGEELKSIAYNSKLEQDKLRQLKRIEALRQQSQSIQSPQQKLLDNIVIDYLRSKKSNYSYSVVMRERNLVSDEIKAKSQLLKMLDLSDLYNSLQDFDSPVLELILIKQGEYLSGRKDTKENGIQVQLIAKDKTVNNVVLNELRIAEVRKSVEEAEKKHYLEMLSALKQQLRVTIGDEIKKQYQLKMKKLKGQYEGQVQVLKDKNKEVLVNNPKLNPKIEQYLTQIQRLENDKLNLITRIKELQKEKTTHNCFANQTISQRAKYLQQQLAQVQIKKKEYDLALKSIHTSVEDLVAKKAALAKAPTQTDLFLAQHKNQRSNKDHMIEEIYGRMFVMDKRIQTISQDNQSLMEENRQLLSKVKQLQSQRQVWLQKSKEGVQKEEKMAKYLIKPKTKEAMVGVAEEQIHETFKQKREHAIDESSSLWDSDQQEQQLRNKQKYKMEVQNLTSQMKLLKNRLRFMVEQFQ